MTNKDALAEAREALSEACAALQTVRYWDVHGETLEVSWDRSEPDIEPFSLMLARWQAIADATTSDVSNGP